MLNPAKGFVGVEAVPRKKGDVTLPPSDFFVVSIGEGVDEKINIGDEIVIRGESRFIPNKEYPFYLIDQQEIAGFGVFEAK